MARQFYSEGREQIGKVLDGPLSQAGDAINAGDSVLRQRDELLEAAKKFTDMVDRFEQDYELGTKGHGLAVCLNNRPGELLRAAIANAGKPTAS